MIFTTYTWRTWRAKIEKQKIERKRQMKSRQSSISMIIGFPIPIVTYRHKPDHTVEHETLVTRISGADRFIDPIGDSLFDAITWNIEKENGER